MTEAGLGLPDVARRPRRISRRTAAARIAGDAGTGGSDSQSFSDRFESGPQHCMTIDEQLAYLRKGMAEIIREEDLRERLVAGRERRAVRCA